ncbi:MAG: amidohydrolase family protein [Hylemonella sp.]
MSAPVASNAPAGDNTILGWDCHNHLFGPYDRYPLATDRSYTPPEALEDGHAEMLRRQGLSHAVLVQPSAYGDDHGRLLEALSTHPHLRGVVVVRPDSTLSLGGLHARGVRAARFSHRSGSGTNFAGSASIEDLKALVPALAEAGLHAELWTDCKALPDIVPVLSQLPFPIVIDHMGGFDPTAGPNQPGFLALLKLVEKGQAWVKLSAYRNTVGMDPELARPFQERLQQANADRLVWGSDWPHLRISPVPDVPELLKKFRHWCDDEALVRRILLDNPQRLYA